MILLTIGQFFVCHPKKGHVGYVGYDEIGFFFLQYMAMYTAKVDDDGRFPYMYMVWHLHDDCWSMAVDGWAMISKIEFIEKSCKNLSLVPQL
jgi:hypothetical protein